MPSAWLGAVESVVRIDLGKPGRPGGRVAGAEQVFHVARRFESQKRDAVLFEVIENGPIQVVTRPPVSAKENAESLFGKRALMPAVEIALRRMAEHLHADGDFSGVPLRQPGNDFQLHPVRLEVVVGFTDVDDAGGGDDFHHLIHGDADAGGNVDDGILRQVRRIAVGVVGGGAAGRWTGGEEKGGKQEAQNEQAFVTGHERSPRAPEAFWTRNA